jgi:hypothetical protein
MKPLLKEDKIKQGDHLVFIGLSKKVEQLFGINLHELNEENKEEKRREAIHYLLGKLSAFSQMQLRRHQEWMDNFLRNDKKKNFESDIKKGSSIILSKANSRLLHLGYATGFDGMTALEYFLSDADRKEVFKAVMAKFNLGNRPGNRGMYVPRPDKFPKSKRLIDNGNAIVPMGWAELFTSGEQLPALEAIPSEEGLTTAQSQEAVETPVEAEFYAKDGKKINPKKPPILDAVVVKPGRPNKVKVYISEDNMPVKDLMGYRNPIEEGTVLRVKTVFNKKVELVQVAYKGKK